MESELLPMKYIEYQEEPENTQFNERPLFFDKDKYIRKHYSDNVAFKYFINKDLNTVTQLYNKSKNLLNTVVKLLRTYNVYINTEYIEPKKYNRYINPSGEFMCKLLDILELVSNEDFLELKFVNLLYDINDYQLLYLTKSIDFDLLQDLNYGNIGSNYDQIYDINNIQSGHIYNKFDISSINNIESPYYNCTFYDINCSKYYNYYEENMHLLTKYEIPEDENTYKGKAIHCCYLNESYYKTHEHIKLFIQSIFIKTNVNYLSQLHGIKKKNGIMTIFENIHAITHEQIYYFIHILTDDNTSIYEKFKYILYYLNYEQLSLIGV
jgi:hypothetical protein